MGETSKRRQHSNDILMPLAIEFENKKNSYTRDTTFEIFYLPYGNIEVKVYLSHSAVYS